MIEAITASFARVFECGLDLKLPIGQVDIYTGSQKRLVVPADSLAHIHVLADKSETTGKISVHGFTWDAPMRLGKMIARGEKKYMYLDVRNLIHIGRLKKMHEDWKKGVIDEKIVDNIFWDAYNAFVFESGKKTWRYMRNWGRMWEMVGV